MSEKEFNVQKLAELGCINLKDEQEIESVSRYLSAMLSLIDEVLSVEISDQISPMTHPNHLVCPFRSDQDSSYDLEAEVYRILAPEMDSKGLYQVPKVIE